RVATWAEHLVGAAGCQSRALGRASSPKEKNDPQQPYRSAPPASTFGGRMLLQRVEARTDRKQTARSGEPLQGRRGRPRDEIRGLDPLSFAQRDRAAVRPTRRFH